MPARLFHRRAAWLLCTVALVAGTTGCAWRDYRPAPVDLAAAASAAVAERLDAPAVRERLAAAGVDLRDWPDLIWNRETLGLAMFGGHPDMQAARARVGAARARIPAVQQPVNPDLSLRSENHSERGDNGSPWSIGAGLQVTLNTRPLLSAQGAVASAEATEAEVLAGETAWRLYRQLGDALLTLQAASEATRLAQEALAIGEARLDSVTIRQRHGAASALELQLAQEAVLAARRELATGVADMATARGRFAQALAIPAAALEQLRVAPWPVLAPGADTEGGGPDAGVARGLALRNRLDLARELALYEVAEAGVRVEVARQYPQIRLSPGLVWDQGDTIWQLGLALPLALLHRNLAAIEAAEARRAAQAAVVLARQAAIVGEVEAARRHLVARVEPLLAARREADAADARVALVRRQFEAGAADATALLLARGLSLQARRHVHDATVAWRQAQWTLEAALQAPLPGATPDALPFAAMHRH